MLHGTRLPKVYKIITTRALSVKRSTLYPQPVRPLKASLVFELLPFILSAQQPPGTLLAIEVENETFYNRDVADPAQFATNPNPVSLRTPRAFVQGVAIGDIASINGRRVKGTVIVNTTFFNLRPLPAPGQAIADVSRAGLYQWHFEILDEESRPIGSIQVNGTSGGPPPPGSPRQQTSGNHVVAGGTGAFLGARGQMGSILGGGAVDVTRIVSITEDPANRRRNGPTGRNRYGIYLIPMNRPEILAASGVAAIVHSGDYSPVSAANPAKAGEVLTLFASGLGPTRPGLDPGQAFTENPLQIVNSPIEILIDGRSAEVLYAGGHPGTVDRYQVNFRLPSDSQSGLATVQLTSAWIAGSDVKIAIR
jgi:hypothetical protein